MVDSPCLCDEKVDSNEPSCICLSGVYIQCEKTLMNFELVNNQASSSFASPKLDRPRQCNKLLFHLLPAPAEREDLYPFFLIKPIIHSQQSLFPLFPLHLLDGDAYAYSYSFPTPMNSFFYPSHPLSNLFEPPKGRTARVQHELMIAIQREVYYPKTQVKQKEFHHGVPKLKTYIKKQKKALRLTESASE